jgi:hypothetical protein
MTIATILISAWITALIWPSILNTAFKPNVGERLNAGSNLDDAMRYLGALLTGFAVIAAISVALILVIA